MAIGRLEVGAAGLVRGWNVPASTSFVGDEGERGELFGDRADEIGVLFDGVQAIGEGEVVAAEGCERRLESCGGGGKDEGRGGERCIRGRCKDVGFVFFVSG